MARSELLEKSSAPKHIIVGTWAMSRKEPHLFYWRDHNSYDDDPWIPASVEPDQTPDEVARAAVIDSLVFEGIDEERAKKAIRGTAKCGTLVDHFLEEGPEDGLRRRKAAMVFVKVMPSVLIELTKRDPHLLFPERVIQPYSRWNGSLERRVELAFKRFVAQR